MKIGKNYTCIESCAAIGNARHGCESLGTDIQSIREIDDSGCMLTNITGSSILKSTDHTSQVKPGKLSVRFILKDREPCIDNPSSRFERTFDSEQSEVVSADESEIGIVSESKMIGTHVKVQMMRMNISMMLLAL